MKPAWYPRLMTRSEQIIEEQDGREEIMSTTAKCVHDENVQLKAACESYRSENCQLQLMVIRQAESISTTLEALKKILAPQVYEDGTWMTDADANEQQTLIAREAIAKAEGKNQK